MTTTSLYIRPQLRTIRRPDTPAIAYRAQWLSALAAQLSAPQDNAATSSLLILTLYGRLLRCNPDDIQKIDTRQTWESFQATISPHIAALANPARTVVNLEEWQRDAEHLAEACDDAVDTQELSKQGERLLQHLDDADLLAYFLRLTHQADETLEDQIRRCSSWLADNPDRLFPAGSYVQAVAETIRSDLLEIDFDLALTADKYVFLLDALEDAYVPMGFHRSKSRPAVITIKSPSWDWLPENSPALAAQTATEEGLLRLCWHSADGAYLARLVIDPADREAVLVRMNFLKEDRPALDLLGRSVRLADCESRIDDTASADFSLPELRRAKVANRTVELRVDSVEQPWVFVTEDVG